MVCTGPSPLMLRAPTHRARFVIFSASFSCPVSTQAIVSELSVWLLSRTARSQSILTRECEYVDADDFMQQRVQRLQQAVKAAGGPSAVPYALVENSSKCNKADDGEKAPLPQRVPWRPALIDKVSCPNLATQARFC